MICQKCVAEFCAKMHVNEIRIKMKKYLLLQKLFQDFYIFDHLSAGIIFWWVDREIFDN